MLHADPKATSQAPLRMPNAAAKFAFCVVADGETSVDWKSKMSAGFEWGRKRDPVAGQMIIFFYLHTIVYASLPQLS